MGILDQIMQMRARGMSEEEIINKLKEQRVSPREITDALSQSQIKNAISNEEYIPTPSNYEPPPPMPYAPYSPQTQEMYEQEYSPPQQDYLPQENYGSYEQPTENAGTETLIEISEQVFEEKTKKIQKQLEDLNEIKVLSQTKMENFSERLKRVESTLDSLQSAILEKVGSYGNTLESIKKEMSMMQDSFGKIVNTALDKSEKRQEIKTKTYSKKK